MTSKHNRFWVCDKCGLTFRIKVKPKCKCSKNSIMGELMIKWQNI